MPPCASFSGSGVPPRSAIDAVVAEVRRVSQEKLVFFDLHPQLRREIDRAHQEDSVKTRMATALAAALIAGAGCSSSTTDPTQPGIDVSIQAGAENRGASAFAPSPFTLSLASDGTVKWRNGDVGTSGNAYGAGATTGTTHTITSDTQGLFDSGSL